MDFNGEFFLVIIFFLIASLLLARWSLSLNMGVICSALMLGVRNEFLFGQFSFTKVVSKL